MKAKFTYLLAFVLSLINFWLIECCFHLILSFTWLVMSFDVRYTYMWSALFLMNTIKNELLKFASFAFVTLFFIIGFIKSELFTFIWQHCKS